MKFENSWILLAYNLCFKKIVGSGNFPNLTVFTKKNALARLDDKNDRRVCIIFPVSPFCLIFI